MLAISATLLARSAWAQVNYNTTTYIGCYSSAGALTKTNTHMYQSFGYCQEQCIPKSGENPTAVMGLNQGSDCWCGMALPPDSDKVDDSECNTGCTGFGTDMCGGDSTFSVYLTGYDDSVGTAAGSGGDSNNGPNDDGSTSASTPAPSSAGQGSNTVTQAPSVITKAGETIVITAPGQAEATSQSSSENGGGNKVGMAVGIVVGIILFAALVGGGVFWMRHRKRKAVEEEYRRNQSINNFVGNDKPHSQSGSSDQRLDPSILHHRRQSDGSIADEMDFSRRILQVSLSVKYWIRMCSNVPTRYATPMASNTRLPTQHK